MAANVIGAATWDATTTGKLTGRIGLESSQDNLLSGSNGFRVVDTAEGSNAGSPAASATSGRRARLRPCS